MDEHEEDVVLEPEAGVNVPDTNVLEDEEAFEGGADRQFAKSRDELATCRKEKQEYMDGWQRAKADYVNLLKRFETETKISELRGKVGAVETLLPAFDALERAKEHGEIPEGFTAIARQLESAFTSLGLAEVGVVGEQFNPALHEALGQDPTDEKEKDDTITGVLEKGWKVGDTVIRPAKVRVAHFQS
ncbi:MAG: nucleotide exchange factor GrpE [Minisyncoccia bacterium]